MGGSNDSDNMIWLYAQEHYYAHKLLALENPDNKSLSLGWLIMCCGNNKNIDRDYLISAEEYERARKLFSQNITGENNPMFGKVVSEETKRKISEAVSSRTHESFMKAASKRKGELHYLFGKHLSEETK